jgi:hypothetical protein
MAKRPKFTPTQIKQHIKKIQETIDKQKRENEGEHFTSVTPEARVTSIPRSGRFY